MLGAETGELTCSEDRNGGNVLRRSGGRRRRMRRTRMRGRRILGTPSPLMIMTLGHVMKYNFFIIHTPY